MDAFNDFQRGGRGWTLLLLLLFSVVLTLVAYSGRRRSCTATRPVALLQRNGRRTRTLSLAAVGTEYASQSVNSVFECR